MYEENGHVSACLVPEPQKEKESNAISVQINYGDGQHHIGYISKELTPFIHPLLSVNAVTKVEIGHIKFCVKCYRIDFCMKLLITRLGKWELYDVSNSASYLTGDISYFIKCTLKGNMNTVNTPGSVLF